MLRGVIFDMDGLLVDSEPLWTEAEMEVFASVGNRLTPADCATTVGMGLEEVVAFRHARKPWSGPGLEEIASAIHAKVAALHRARSRPMPGALEALAAARARGLRVGLASSSDPVLIEAALGKLGIRDRFDHVQSADELSHSKPHPEVYLVCARALGIEPRHCVGFEDSLPGLIAVKAARMRAVAVPEPRLASDPRFSIADVVLGSLEELNASVWARLEQAP